LFTGQLALGTNPRRIGVVAADYAFLDQIVDSMLRQSAERPQSIDRVKELLIARCQAFVARQKVDELSGFGLRHANRWLANQLQIVALCAGAKAEIALLISVVAIVAIRSCQLSLRFERVASSPKREGRLRFEPSALLSAPSYVEGGQLRTAWLGGQSLRRFPHR
jgi:hypothetical protein